MFNELLNEISKDIQKYEQRSRLRTTEEQSRFEYAVTMNVPTISPMPQILLLQ